MGAVSRSDKAQVLNLAANKLTGPSVNLFWATGLKLFKMLSILHMAWLLVFVV
jgi:hypothetical protein